MTTSKAFSKSHSSWVVAATSLGFALIQLDVSIVNVALPHIAEDLHCGVAVLQWVVNAYTLAFSAFLLSAGLLGDRCGSKPVFLSGIALFGVSSLACGAAVSASFLVTARAVQGAGAALILPASLAILNRAFEHDRHARTEAVGKWTAAGGVAIAIGPIAGGLLMAPLGWRSIFYVNLPLCVLGAFMTLRYVESAAGIGKNRRFDLPGQVLAILALGFLTAGIVEIRPLGWHATFVWSSLSIAAVAAGAFIWVEKHSSSPMVPMSFFSLPNFSPAVLFGFIVNLAYYGVIFVLSLFLQEAQGFSAIRAGLAFLPLTASFIISNLVSGRITRRIGTHRTMAIGACICGTGFALLLRVTAHTPYPNYVPALVLIPLGMGLAVPAMTATILGTVQKGNAGIASGVLNAARQAGGAIGVSWFGALVGSQASEIVGGLHTSALAAVAMLIGAAVMAIGSIHPDVHALSKRIASENILRD